MEMARKDRFEKGFLAKSMDMSVDPFDNFYQYACGSWLKRHNIPKDKPLIGSFQKLSDLTDSLLRDIVYDSVGHRTGTNCRVVRDLYLSFMDYRTRNALGFAPVANMLNDIEALNSKEQLIGHLAAMELRGVSAFFEIEVSEDAKDSSVYALYAWQGGISLPDRDYYLAERFARIRKRYLRYIRTVFDLYGGLVERAGDFSNTVLAVEKGIAAASRPNSELIDPVKNYHLMKISAFDRRYRNIRFKDFCRNIGAKDIRNVVVGQPDFFDSIDRLIAKSSVSDIKIYLQWRVLNSLSMLLGKNSEDRAFDFYGTALIGTKKMRPRWKRALSFVKSAGGEALGELYARRYLTKRETAKAKLLAEDIRLSLIGRIKELDWMGGKTKAKALEKLMVMKVKVGKPKKFRNYGSLITDKKTLMENWINAYRFDFDRDMARIGKKVDEDEWEMDVHAVNAMYNPAKNSIIIPAGILKPPFFDAAADDAVNYACIGSVIGHEITHGFDSSGSKFDKDGNMVEWWGAKDRAKFEKKCGEVERLYGSIDVLPGIKLNGKLTVLENVADLGGLRIAYDALEKSVERSRRKSIAGFTPEQRFFISNAQLWKGKKRIELKKMYALVDTHSPEDVRGLVPIVTHPAFKNAFAGLSRLDKIKQPHKEISVW